MAENTTAASAQFVGTGSAATIGGKFSDQRKYDRSDKFILQRSAYYPFTTVLVAGDNALPKRQVTDSKFLTFLDSDYKRIFTPSQASGSGDGTEDIVYLAAADARQVKVGDIFTVDGMFTDGTSMSTTFTAGYHAEQIKVLSIGTEGTNTPITVQREIASATEITTSMNLVKSGNALADGYTAGSGFSVEPEDDYNYVQNFSKTFGVDEIRENTDAWGPDDMIRMGTKTQDLFMQEMNEAHHFGVRGLVTDPVSPVQTRRMGGMMEFIPSGNQTTGVGTLTIEKLNNYSVTHFAQGSKMKWVFAGPQAMTYLSNKSDDRLVYNDALSKKIGIPMIYEFASSNGVYRFVLDGSFYGRGTWISQAMFIYDIAYLRRTYMKNLDIRLRKNIQTSREHLRQDEICGSLSLERAFANAHHALFGITG